LSYFEGVAMIVGANIGAGLLGWPVMVFFLILAGVFTTISMLYVAETSPRTRKPLQLSGPG